VLLVACNDRSMDIRIAAVEATAVTADAIVVSVFTDGKLEGDAAALDHVLGGAIADMLASREITGKANQISLVHAKDHPFRRALVVGLGDRKKFTLNKLAQLAGAAVRYLGRRSATTLAFALPVLPSGEVARGTSFLIEGAIAGSFETTTYQSQVETPISIEQITIVPGQHDRNAIQAGIAHGEILGLAINVARLMALTPGNDLTPTQLASRAKDLAAQAGLEYDLIDEDQMRAKGMGALLAVSQGSEEPATLSVLRHNGDPGSSEVLALVGKGITFDSGGISIKSADNMHQMKYDMSGGAGVIAALYAMGKLNTKLNVIGIIPSSENMPGPRAMKPGDVVRAMNGKTIEIQNTDAEGRLILADALCYARELGATKLVDCATLTGSCIVALGHDASGVMANDEEWVTTFLRVTKDCGERHWRLPLFEEFTTAVKSDIADLKNISEGTAAGTQTAAAFLEAFVADVPWIHLDIAGPAWLDNEAAFHAKGPTGVPVRTFVALAEALSEGAGAHANGAAKSVSLTS
jgi:leucyl aminopeptidase